MKVSVVILNWNTKGYLERFLPGVLRSCQAVGDAEVVVADNGSTDGSLELLACKFPEVKTIPLGANFGFTGGYNRALSEIGSDYAVLLNSDIEVTDGWLSPLVSWMDSHPNCAAAGPKLISFHDRDSFEYAGAAGGCIDTLGFPFCRGRVPGRLERDFGQYDDASPEVFWISGAALLVRMSLWKELGGLDERFFAHMEEIDWCWRAQLAGFDICLVPSSTVYHIGGGTLPSQSQRKLRLNYRNNLLLLENNLARTFVATGDSPIRALRRAERHIRFRMAIDDLALVTYLLSGRPESMRAVREAHSEFRKLRRKDSVEALRGWAEGTRRRGPLRGIYRGSIVIATILHGERIFEYLRRTGNI